MRQPQQKILALLRAAEGAMVPVEEILALWDQAGDPRPVTGAQHAVCLLRQDFDLNIQGIRADEPAPGARCPRVIGYRLIEKTAHRRAA